MWIYVPVHMRITWIYVNSINGTRSLGQNACNSQFLALSSPAIGKIDIHIEN